MFAYCLIKNKMLFKIILMILRKKHPFRDTTIFRTTHAKVTQAFSDICPSFHHNTSFQICHGLNVLRAAQQRSPAHHLREPLAGKTSALLRSVPGFHQHRFPQTGGSKNTKKGSFGVGCCCHLQALRSLLKVGRQSVLSWDH